MSTTQQRTLLLAPPSIASHEETLQRIYASGTVDKSTSDLTMLDRLSSGLVSLPSSTYDLVIVLVDSGDTNTREEAVRILTRRVYDAVAGAMKPGAVLRALEGCSPPLPEGEAILAGLVSRGSGEFVKAEEEAPVLLRFGGKKKKDNNKESNGVGVNGVNNGNGNANGSVPVAQKPQATTISLLPDDDLEALDGGDDDDEFIDEGTLLTTDDINQTLKPRMSRPPLPLFFQLSHKSNPPFSPPKKQQQNVSPNSANAAVPAKTAPAAWPPGSRPKTPRVAPRPMRTSTSCASPPTTSTTSSSTSPSRARSDPAGPAVSATPSAAPIAPIWAYLLLSLARKSLL